MNMQLSNRMMSLASLVTSGYKLADIGCDHAYLPIWLIREGIIPSALAMDVRKGPLERAEEHVRENGLADRIELRLSDGLEKLSPGEVDCCIIAGMGGPLMERILSAYPEVTASMKEMILQPQSDLPHFRKFLLENGWQIIEERALIEDGKYYFPMKVVPGGIPVSAYDDWTEVELAYGKMLLQKKDPVLFEYLQKEKCIREKIKQSMTDARGEQAEQRLKEVEKEEQLIDAALKAYEVL